MRFVSFVLALSLTSSAAFAGNSAPLPSGVPAGVKHAQLEGNTGLYLVLGAIAIAGIAIAASSGGNNSAPTPAPTTTS